MDCYRFVFLFVCCSLDLHEQIEALHSQLQKSQSSLHKSLTGFLWVDIITNLNMS
jgi:hypothetical protein